MSFRCVGSTAKKKNAARSTERGINKKPISTKGIAFKNEVDVCIETLLDHIAERTNCDAVILFDAILIKIKSKFHERFGVPLFNDPPPEPMSNDSNYDSLILDNVTEFIKTLNRFGGNDRISMLAKTTVGIALSGGTVPVGHVILLLVLLNMSN